ncbi:MAG TPA: DinB family protein [Candidatus Bathyarchaeia archaeon]|nr:DinB family protein [Candidatus Bathyarchaeia archaeon]
MEMNDILIDAFARIKEVVHDVVDSMSEDQLVFRPAKDANSIAWLIWHLTRVQDDHMSELAERQQTWTTEGWYDKFNLPFNESATGYGHTSAEVEQVRASAKLLAGYYDAVHKQSVQFLTGLNDADYHKIIDTNWEPPVTMAVRIVSVITDDLQHVGQAAYIKGLRA